MSDTSIEWATKVWNPVTGCTHVSEGCDHCYAARLASGRLKHHPDYEGLAEVGRYNGTIRLLPDRLEDPLHWRKPERVFVNSMSDLFHDDVPREFIVQVFAVMGLAARHTFQVLTKRPGRMASLLNDPEFGRQVYLIASQIVGYRGDTEADNSALVANVMDEEMETMRDFLPNVWVGTSVESQHWADVRIPKLLETPAAVRFLSCEPLLGPIDLKLRASNGARIDCLTGDVIDPRDGAVYASAPGSVAWVIVGGESGPGARAMDVGWLRSIVEQCDAAAVPVFVKQDSGPRSGQQGRIPDELWRRKEYPDGE